MSTIFISHSSADNALAVELLDWLKSQGYLSVFLDLDPDEGIEAGEHWENVLYRELVSCSVVLALVTENWLASKWCFAEATHARSDGKTILGLTADRGVQPAILADTQSIDYSPDNRTDAYQRLAEALRRAIDPQGLGRWDPTRPLFPGLLFFDERDAPIFFGRRRLGRAIYQKLRELQAKPPGSERLLLVFGPSGSGKSSVVRAGTLPHVHASPDTWITLGPFRPTEGWPEPLRQSIDVLAGTDEEAFAAKLREVADQLRGEAKAPKAAILLIIDQLEESLDIKDGAETAFWLPLSRLLAPIDTPFMSMATLRSDFMGDFQKRSARNLVHFGSFPIEPMSPEDLREVYTGPCRVAGIAIEAGLVDALVEDAGDEQALPLLALALNRLWLRYEAKQGGFTLTDYRDGLGGMRGLIDREAESTLAGKGLREASVLDAFLSLTRQVREGVLARQPTAWDGLETEAQKSLEPFIGARLLVRYSIDGDKSGTSEENGTVVIDLIHETLLSGWQRLYNWVSRPENRDFLPWREELRHKVSRWLQTNERKALLLDGAELKEAKKWLKAKRLALNTQEAAYIQEAIEAKKISRVKLAVAVAVLVLVGSGWWGWTRTDFYQIRAVEHALPEIMRTAVDSDEGYKHFGKFTELTNIGRSDLAILIADKFDNDARTKTLVIGDIALALAKAGQMQEAIQVLAQAEASADKIADASGKADAFLTIAEALLATGQTQRTAQVLGLALSAAKKTEDPDNTNTKASALTNVAEALAKAGLTQEAQAAADNIEDTNLRAYALQVVAQALARAGQTQGAMVAADKIENADLRASILKDVAQALARAGQTKGALATADKIDNTGYRESAILDVAKALVIAGQTQEALAAVDKIENTVSRASALRDVAKTLATSDQTQQAVQVLGLALSAVEKIENVDWRASALRDVAEALAKAGQPQEALATADKIADSDTKAYAFRDIAEALAKVAQTQEAIQILAQAEVTADKIADSDTKADAFQSIAEALAKAGQTHLALAVTDKIGDARQKSNTLLENAKLLTEAGKLQEAVQILVLAETTAGKIADSDAKAAALQDIAQALATAGHTEEALAAADKIDDAFVKASALHDVAEALAKAGQTQGALAAADKIGNASELENEYEIKLVNSTLSDSFTHHLRPSGV